MNLMPIIVMGAVLSALTLILAVADIFLGSHGEKVIDINNTKKINITGEDTLLNCLSANKIFIPSACGGKSTCGHCKVVVKCGGGEILATEKGFLTNKEVKEGVRLACQVKVKDNIKISLPDELLEVQEYTATVAALDDLTSDIKLLRLDLITPKAIRFKPGQYVQIFVPGYEVFRAYSVASPPSMTNSIEFTIRYIPKGMCTTFIHKALKVGDKVKFTGPYGHFYLDENSERPIICIAGGAGMAPIRSIVYHLKEQNMPRKISYYFGARTKKDLFFVDELKQIEADFPNFKYRAALSEPTPQDCWEGDTGFVTDAVKKYEGDLTEHEAYLCGPPPMLDAAVKVLTAKGLNEKRVLFDKF